MIATTPVGKIVNSEKNVQIGNMLEVTAAISSAPSQPTQMASVIDNTVSKSIDVIAGQPRRHTARRMDPSVYMRSSVFIKKGGHHKSPPGKYTLFVRQGQS
jgi:hypothetical protein